MDFALIDVTFFIISMALSLIILDGHICAVILDGIAARVVGCVTLALHIGMFVCLVLARVPLEFLVLMFMASIFLYCLAYYIRYRLEQKKEIATPCDSGSPSAPCDAVSAEAEQGGAESEVPAPVCADSTEDRDGTSADAPNDTDVCVTPTDGEIITGRGDGV